MKKSIIDIMIDFETFGRQPNSVPINLAAVAFSRYADENPFILDVLENKQPSSCVKDVDVYLSGCTFATRRENKGTNYCQDKFSRAFLVNINVMDSLMLGLRIEPDTQAWWMKQSQEAKDALHPWNGEVVSLHTAIKRFLNWVESLLIERPYGQICLWAQGSDFDIAKLRYLVALVGEEDRFCKLIPHTALRDARTAILEMGACLYDGQKGFSVSKDGIMFPDGEPNREERLDEFNDIYSLIPSFSNWALTRQSEDKEVMANYLLDIALSGCTHHSLYDCMRSIYNLWWLFKALDTQFK